MPNPNILFQNIPSATPQQAFQGVLQNQAALNQFQQQPMQNRLLQAQTEGAEMRNQAMGQQMDQEYAKFALQDLATDWGSIKPLIANGDLQNANVAIAQRIQKILSRRDANGNPGDPSDTIELRDRLNSGLITPEQAIAEVDGALEGARQAGLLGRGVQGAAYRDFQAMTEGLAPDQRERARLIELGLAPRAMGSAAITIAEQGKTEDVAGSQAVIKAAEAGAAEGAKLNQQAEKLPSVQGAVTAAKEAAKSGSKETGKAKSNATALRVYETGITNLKTALGDTTTGPMIGWMPAFTSNQQKAEGAVAAMAPILKEIFRSAGEGTFTEGDQRLLMDMIPGRGTLPEAADAQLQAIDQIVRAKLGGGAQPQQPAQQGQPTGGVKFLGFE